MIWEHCSTSTSTEMQAVVAPTCELTCYSRLLQLDIGSYDPMSNRQFNIISNWLELK
ncbi:MAG: hypothetical protein MIO93_08860 [ANME-2 cluster archaeon]|nr:hypothetical protein [ANME-2 cluster archaeon]